MNNNPPFLTLFPAKSNIYCFPTLKELTHTFPSELKHFKGAIVIDAKLEMYHIKEAVKTGWGNRFRGISLLYKERIIKIDLLIKSSEVLSLQRIKEILAERIREKPFGKHLKEIFETKQNLLHKIQHVETGSDLMQLFLYDE